MPPADSVIVYAGPSISHREAADILPGASLRSPVRRWDLYRDREAGGAVFVILDGVFLQEDAVSPREVLDVLADGGHVIGAASMGALRAAECWPAGMSGVGTIYRLFRRGRLLSDDEVAVVFSPDGDSRLLSVPLINVRYAVSRGVREGWLERAQAERLVRAAEETFYPERQWPDLLARAGCGGADALLPRLAACDLKKLDAERALRRVARRLERDPGLCRPPSRRAAPFVPRDGVRERAPDALDGADPAAVRPLFAQWQLISGRAARHLLAIAAAHPELQLAERLRKKAALGSLAAELYQETGNGTAGAAAVQMVLFDLWTELSRQDGGFSAWLWAELALAGDLDAEILRWRAVREGAEAARQMDLKARGRDRYLAEMEIANAHGFAAWRDLRQAVRKHEDVWKRLRDCRDELALAKRLREALFSPAPLQDGAKPWNTATG